jgi:hypothetical protein
MEDLWVKNLYFGIRGNLDWRFINTYDVNTTVNTLSLQCGSNNVMTFTQEYSFPIVRFDANVQFHLEGTNKYLELDTVNELAIY